MNKVMIVGNIAAGKSTFAKKLHNLTGIKLIHLDNLYFEEDRTYMTVVEWIGVVAKISQENSWIIDGNYPQTLEIRANQADTIFIFDISRMRCSLNLLKRFFYCKMLKRKLDCNSKSDNYYHAIKKIWSFNTKKKRFYDEILMMERKHIHYFKSIKEANSYLSKYNKKANTKIGVKLGTVKLEKYTVLWKQLYVKEETLLKKMLKNKDILIEHIGSTAIPGIESKPIIDVLVVIPNDSVIEDVIRKLIIAGYYKSSFKLDGEVFLKKTDGISSTHYLHLTKQNQGDWKRYVLFRNYLTQNPHIAKEYEDLKKKLAEKYANDRIAYTSTKKIYIDKILHEIKLKNTEFTSLF